MGKDGEVLMHPAKSVIFFTTATGAGYGLLFWAALFILRGDIFFSELVFILIASLSLLLITAGLLSSTLHLGHPERAWRALSQWRTSWLSREGVAALLAYIPVLLFGWLWYTNAAQWLLLITGIVLMLAVMATVVCTAMIYASLKPIPSWHNAATITGYPLYSLATGAVLLWTLSIEGSVAIPWYIAPVSLLAAMICKIWHWRLTDKPVVSTIASATGLTTADSGKKVRVFELPHDSPNYLMKEMGFTIARKYATPLRLFTLLAAFIVPALWILLAPVPNTLSASLILIVCATGIAVERWLFFAQAFHLVGLYYGRTS